MRMAPGNGAKLDNNVMFNVCRGHRMTYDAWRLFGVEMVRKDQEKEAAQEKKRQRDHENLIPGT